MNLLQQRSEEKIKARKEQQLRIDSGEITKEQANLENSCFKTGFASSVKLNFNFLKKILNNYKDKL